MKVTSQLIMQGVFSPKSISGLYMWVDFTVSPKQLNGNKIIQINDLSNNGYHLSQSTDANRPTWSTGGTNGKSYASIDINKCLNSLSIATAQPVTVVAVIDQKSWVQARKIINTKTGYNGFDQYAIDGRNNIMPVAGTVWATKIYNQGNLLNKTITIGYIFNGANTTYLMNNAYLWSPNINLGSGGIENLAVGSMNAGATSAKFDIYELIVYNKALSIPEAYNIQRYLNVKYSGFLTTECYGFGDSLMQGGTYSVYSFINAVADSYGAIGFNMGVSGSSLTSGSPNCMDNQIRINLPYLNRSRKFILEIGTNDITSSKINDTWNTSYRSLVSYMISQGVTPSNILLVTPPYYSTKTAALTLIQGYYAQMATDYGVKYVDCVAPTLAGGGDTLVPDGLHPNQAGVTIIANTIISNL